MNVDVVILAAGQGTRMKSKLPKVLHSVAGKSLVKHVIDTAKRINGAKISVVIGHGAEQVQSQYAELDVHWVIQEQAGQLIAAKSQHQITGHIDPCSALSEILADVELGQYRAEHSCRQ